MRDWTGQQVGNYQVFRLLERGTVADRYFGYDLSSQRQVALHLLAEPTDEAGIQRFQRNAPICRRLVHPHIAPFREAGVQDMTPFVVLDCFPTSRQYHQFPLPVSVVIQYASQLADAFDYTHSQGNWPTPTCPETILIGDHGKALLAGFGWRLLEISQRAPEEREFGWHSSVSATYLSPEQLAGAWPVGKHCDQYALAVVVYEWLCGVPPFQGSSPLDIAMQHLRLPPPSLQEKVPTISQALDQVIKKALAKKPEERFESNKAFSTALREASKEE